jgi:hypothetical protein
MRAWVATLDLLTQDIPNIWDTFVANFTEQFTDTQATIWAQAKLDDLKMTYPHIDKYISEFEETARKAGYTQTHEEIKHHFMQGLANEILEDVLRAPRPVTYTALKTHAIKSTHTRMLLKDILKRKTTPAPYRPPF